MDASEYRYMRDFLLRKMGLSLSDDKQYLLKSRLTRLLREHNLADVNVLSQSVRRDENGVLANQVMDAMTTNETLFFRDQYPFDALRDMILPELIRSKGKIGKIKIWSAASSTGQEAYSIAMTASQCVPERGNVHVFGTDLSAKAADYARTGSYTQMEVQRGLPVQLLLRYFDQDGSRWNVKPELKAMTRFETSNLIEERIMMQARSHGPFDVVFCRNVLIYFTPEERCHVIDRLARCMQRGGYLITGAAETPSGIKSQWEQVLFKGKRIWKLL
ncbi:protein-glutamate O-methyltransferase CheR [Mariprofundus erugo]|uniref:protein-glutamate O-methyltransferase n=1 Tax=Mariprofundus erugo TaxID=2528639 RepID=A0A5R9GVI8_9PROT|nr:protein-glutamate O-methyltransferase CheR [Mariprofundus erugo]TLS67992.1 protein-glutamate O-methyltransferase CheR [Mariprofundus erugo]TLS74871.1 protein-glutamate O-methyltransferase CheR [Mariprofundus erugo]